MVLLGTAMIRTFEELEQTAKSKPSRRLALAMAEEADALKAVVTATEQGVVEPILVGNKRLISEIAGKEGLDISRYRIESAEGEEHSAARAVELVREGEAAVLRGVKMRGENARRGNELA